MSRPDDFNAKVIRALADRVNGLCSRPTCARPTRGPHTEDDRAVNLGKASHIHAASPGGPRYNPRQTPEQRRSATNGIWLCSDCATLVDADEEAFPAATLYEWKAKAEVDATIRLEAASNTIALEVINEATQQLLHYPQGLPNGEWLDRPELGEIAAAVDDPECAAVVLLGPPGSGKSALLARLGADLRAQGWNVVAFRADRLPREIATSRSLREFLGLSLPAVSVLYALSRTRKTALLVDQLDALSDLLDVHTERLSVLLTLIAEASGIDNLSVVCSVREFDFHHDTRFERLQAKQVRLAPLSSSQVDGALLAANVNPHTVPARLRPVIANPHWLKEFLRLSFGAGREMPNTWQALLEDVWRQRVLRPSEVAGDNERAAARISSEISQREELWIPRAAVTQLASAVDRLLAAGILGTYSDGRRIGFVHQSFYEFARARAFVAGESLTQYVSSRQGSLFVRPGVWTSLSYLRGADEQLYRRELHALWGSELRPHLRLLLLEFLGEQELPDDAEVMLLVSVLRDSRWAAPACHAVARSPGWFERLRTGHLQMLMQGAHPGLALEILVTACNRQRDQVLELLERHWIGKADCASLAVAVLSHLESWTDEALRIADLALSKHPQEKEGVGRLAWHLSKTSPRHGTRLLGMHLRRSFREIKSDLPRSPPLPENATPEEHAAWYVQLEPRSTIERILHEASSHSVLIELAKSAPAEFLAEMTPWFVDVLEPVAHVDVWHHRYRDDHILDAKPGDGSGPVHEVGDAFRVAAEALANEAPDDFRAFMHKWTSSDLLSLHFDMSYGLERLAATRPNDVLEYLLADARRLSLGDYGDSTARSTALLRALGPSLDKKMVARLAQYIIESEPSSESQERHVTARRAASQLNRAHRLSLLLALPQELLPPNAAGLVDRESRIFTDELDARESGRRGRIIGGLIGSPMLAAQMERARNKEILGLFEELDDSTGFRHPRRLLDGGTVQASRELAQFAKRNPERAIAIIRELQPGRQENPAGEVLRALAETDFPTDQLTELAAELDARGFQSPDFRTDVAWALQDRAVKEPPLPMTTLQMLRRWLREIPAATPGTSISGTRERSAPPSIWGPGGGGVLPRSGYPILEALTLAYLSREPPDATSWIDVLAEHLERNEAPDVWLAMTRRLENLRACDRGRAQAFLQKLFARYPEILRTHAGIVLLANVSWWTDGDLTRSWVDAVGAASWEHASYVHGELLGFLGVRSPTVDWARSKLDELIATSTVDAAVLGATNSLAHLWSRGEYRDNCTPRLLELINRRKPDIHDAIVRWLIDDESAIDEDAAAILTHLTSYPGAFVRAPSGRAVAWVASLAHAYPEAVVTFCENLLSGVGRDSVALGRLFAAAEELVNLSITLQRLPGFRERGLGVFEALLELGVFGARHALENVDALRHRDR